MRAALALFVCLTCLPAQNPPDGKPKEVYPAFHDAEIYLIHDFFRPGAGHPVGAAVKGLKLGSALPAELDKKLADFPESLAKRMPPPPEGYQRKICGHVALLVQSATNLVVDIVSLLRQR
jgi:hypothetical protein